MIGWDHVARAWVVAHRHAALDGTMWMLSAVGRGGMVWLALGAFTAWRRSCAQHFVTLGVALICATLVADHILKRTKDLPCAIDLEHYKESGVACIIHSNWDGSI